MFGVIDYAKGSTVIKLVRIENIKTSGNKFS
jgi:hypothetical protein